MRPRQVRTDVDVSTSSPYLTVSNVTREGEGKERKEGFVVDIFWVSFSTGITAFYKYVVVEK